jgi:hypothetical protein
MFARHSALRSAGRYRRVWSNCCAYCGVVPAGTWDHVYPVTSAAKLAGLGIRIDPSLMVMVRACSQCNSIAGSKLFKSLATKRAYIRRRLGLPLEFETEAVTVLVPAINAPTVTSNWGKCARPDCDQTFALSGLKKYCCSRCRDLEVQRRHPHKNPATTICQYCGNKIAGYYGKKYCDLHCRYLFSKSSQANRSNSAVHATAAGEPAPCNGAGPNQVAPTKESNDVG